MIQSSSLFRIAFLFFFLFPSTVLVGQDRQLPPKQLIYFDDSYYFVDRFEGDSVVLKVQMQLTDHPDFKDMPAALPEVRLRYFGIQDSTLFYDLFEKQQFIYKSYADFIVSFDKITRLTHVNTIVITQAYIRQLRSDGYSTNVISHPAFPAKLSIYNCHLDTLSWLDLQFKDSVHCDNVVSRRFNISGCIFDREVYIADVNTAHIPLPDSFGLNYNIFGSEFNGNLILYRESRNAKMTFSRSQVHGLATMDNWGYDYDIPGLDSTIHFTLWNSLFERLLIKDKIRGMSISKVNVQKELNISTIEWEPKIYGISHGLKNIFTKESAVLTLTPDQDIGETEIGLDALQHITLNYSNPPMLFHNEDDYYATVQQNIDRLKQYVNEYKTANKSQKDDVLAWLDYQAEKYRREYYRKHLFEDGNTGKLFVSNFLEFFVRNGYHGEWVFLSRALFLITLFMLIYVGFFRKTIDAYVTKEEFFDPNAHPSQRLKPLPPEKPVKVSISDYMLSITRGMWFSFVVFVNPKFPSKYFKFHKPLLFVIIIEWSIGLFMLILFAFFIASKFPFIKTLFGI
jgi:hypothetical protein